MRNSENWFESPQNSEQKYVWHLILCLIIYQLLNTNSFGEGMDSHIPTAFALVLSCELTNPEFIMVFAYIVNLLGMKRYNFFVLGASSLQFWCEDFFMGHF